MSDVLLIQPQSLLDDLEIEATEHHMPPLGLSYVGGVLREAGYDVGALDMVVEGTVLDDLVSRLEAERPSVVGISCTTISYGRAMDVAQKVREVVPGALIVIGGVHVTFTAEDTLAEPVFDVVVRHEGEHAMRDIVAWHLEGKPDLAAIPGISFRRDGQIVHNEDQEFIKDLDALPFAAVDLFQLDRYDIHPISTSRGCPLKCIFCSAGFFTGGKYRVRSPENVVAEVRAVRERHDRHSFYFVDDTMTAFRRHVIGVCEALAEQCPGITWRCESRVNKVDEELLALMRRSGCVGVQYGVECGSQEVMDQLGKYITLDQVRRAVELTLRADIPEVCCSFIIGHPFDTIETVRQTFEFTRELREIAARVGQGTVRIELTPLVPFPGTAVYERAEEMGLTLKTRNWADYARQDSLIDTLHIDRRTLRQLLFEYQTTYDLPDVLKEQVPPTVVAQQRKSLPVLQAS